MIFSINEDGDLYIDKDNNAFSDYTADSPEESNFKIARSSVITYFKHKGFLKNNFIMYKRNNFEDSYIRTLIQNELDIIFKNKENILNKIGFSFANKGSTFLICFYYKMNKDKNVSLLYDTITI